MVKECEICGKKRMNSTQLTFSHKSTKNVQQVNLQKVRVNVNGQVKTMNVCTSCIRAGKVTKA